MCDHPGCECCEYDNRGQCTCSRPCSHNTYEADNDDARCCFEPLPDSGWGDD